MVGIFDPGCELLPPWTKELCVLLPHYLLSDPFPKVNIQNIQTVCGYVGGGVELCCRPYYAGV
jgi:hypothetical protein